MTTNIKSQFLIDTTKKYLLTNIASQFCIDHVDTIVTFWLTNIKSQFLIWWLNNISRAIPFQYKQNKQLKNLVYKDKSWKNSATTPLLPDIQFLRQNILSKFVCLNHINISVQHMQAI